MAIAFKQTSCISREKKYPWNELSIFAILISYVVSSMHDEKYEVLKPKFSVVDAIYNIKTTLFRLLMPLQ